MPLPHLVRFDWAMKRLLRHIVYFDLGQGTDYVYHGRTEFRGIHNNDILKLSKQGRLSSYNYCLV